MVSQKIRNVTTGLLEEYKKFLLTRKVVSKSDKTIPEDELPNLSIKTIIDTLQAVTLPLKEAKRLGMISINPAEALAGLAKSKRERGILTSEEIQKLFSVEWRDEKSKLANLLACLTGLRAGEIAALHPEDLRFEKNRGIITVFHITDLRDLYQKTYMKMGNSFFGVHLPNGQHV